MYRECLIKILMHLHKGNNIWPLARISQQLILDLNFINKIFNMCLYMHHRDKAREIAC